MNRRIRVSTVIPTYNTNINLLARAMRSVLEQEGVDDLELIVVDDSIDEHIVQLLDTDEFRQVRLINGPRNGVGAARSMGYNLAKYDLIAHMDGDDICHPQRFVRQASAIYSGVDLCGTNTRYFGIRSGGQTFVESDSAVRFSFAFGAFVSQPSVMVNRSTLREDGLFNDLDICEDYESWCRLAAKGYCFRNLRMRLLNYRLHSEQATVNKKDRIARASAKIRRDYIDAADFSSAFRQFFVEHGQQEWIAMPGRDIEEFWRMSLSEGSRWGVHPQDTLRIFYAVLGRSYGLSSRLLVSSLFAPRFDSLWLDSEIQIKSKLSIMRKIMQDALMSSR